MFYLKLRERDARDLLRELRDHRASLGKRQRRLSRRVRKAEAEGNLAAAEQLRKEERGITSRIAFLSAQIQHLDNTIDNQVRGPYGW